MTEATPKTDDEAELTEASAVVEESDGAEEANEPTEAQEVDEAEDTDAAGEVGEDDSSGSGRLGELEHEGDIAADFLEELLDIADLDGDIDMDVEGDRAAVSVVGGDLQSLVGSDGEVLEALQELTRLAVYRETGQRSRLMLDIAGHRAARREALVSLARRTVEEVQSSGEPVRLDPMNPFERKVVHDAVAAAGLRSESEGEEPHRQVVVHRS
jgi:spoIIIJ-associated protein